MSSLTWPIATGAGVAFRPPSGSLPADDIQSVIHRSLEGPNLSMGPQIAAFEKYFCDYTGAKHAIGVNSGTAGLHLCVRAAGIQVATWFSPPLLLHLLHQRHSCFENAIPVFVDADPRTGEYRSKPIVRSRPRPLCWR